MNQEFIIVEDSQLSTKQSKYLLCDNFSEALEESRPLVSFICEYFRKHGFIVQEEADAIPYLSHNNEIFRLWDVNCISPITKQTIHVECKDFSQLLLFPGTGLPKVYIDKMLKYVLPNDLIIFFKDSDVFVDEWCRAQPYKSFFFNDRKTIKTKQELLEEMIRKGFAINYNGEIKFIPYGNRLSVLMDNLLITKKPIPCSWRKFKGVPQYIFKMDCMKPMNELIKGI